jgi:hypothetical protein
MSNPQAGFVQFYSEPVEHKFESERQGRPIFRDMPFIRKLTPGDPSNVIERPADDADKQNYPREWAIFEREEAVGVSGTPLEQWPQIKRSQVREAKYFEVHTVEQLAELNDSVCQKLGMGFVELRNQAKAYLQIAEGQAPHVAQAAENERLRNEIEQLKAQFANMGELKRGRPAKVAEAA